jgi:hypothetical protein
MAHAIPANFGGDRELAADPETAGLATALGDLSALFCKISSSREKLQPMMLKGFVLTPKPLWSVKPSKLAMLAELVKLTFASCNR